MFPIVFSGDENYLKYTAVCITSIVRNTDTSRVFSDFLDVVDMVDVVDNDNIGHTQNLTTEHALEQTPAITPVITPKQNPSKTLETLETLENIHSQEGYIFHILTDYISENTKNKLAQLATELNLIFPTQIKIHILGNEEFIGQPPWRNNYLAYYRIKVDKVLDADVDKVIYLDGDTLVNCDIRELFAVDLGDNICGAVANISPRVYSLPGRFDNIQYNFPRDGRYFNSGVMLMNLNQWRAQDIEAKIFTFLRKYITKAPDQDALNAVIGQAIVKLPYKWNMMVDKKRPPSETINIDEAPHYNNQHTRANYLEGLENPKIIHYATKPWTGSGFFVTRAYKSYYFPNFDLWWNMVAQTPVFKEELEAIKESASYKKKLKKEQDQEKMLTAGSQSLRFLWFKFRREIKPFMKKMEKPFQKIRNKIRSKKMKNYKENETL